MAGNGVGKGWYRVFYKRQVPWVEQGLWEQSAGSTVAAPPGLEVTWRHRMETILFVCLVYCWFVFRGFLCVTLAVMELTL